jgi:uncharacterized protein YggU (UPF0235/DUF167 family)
MRLEIHVHPGASRNAVGGTHDGALIVRVTDPAERGRATRSALRLVADALAVPPQSVNLVRGSTTRRKLVEITIATAAERPAVEKRLRRLLDQ